MADILAKKAKDLLGVRVWLDDLPEDIYPLVLLDVHWVGFRFNKVPGILSGFSPKKKNL